MLTGKKKLSLRIDVRYNRICIHRSSLKEIGNPALIRIGIHPPSLRLMLYSAETDDSQAIRVTYNGSGSYYICSKTLVEEIRDLCDLSFVPGSYCFFGKRIETMQAIVFSLKKQMNKQVETGIPGGKQNAEAVY